jgi:hypothetical protein
MRLEEPKEGARADVQYMLLLMAITCVTAVFPCDLQVK